MIGVSGDSDASHRRFAGRHKLPYHLVSDADGSLRAKFGVTKTLGLFPGRVTFLIDKQGVIRHVVSSTLLASRHVSEMLRVLRSFRSPDWLTMRKAHRNAPEGCGRDAERPYGQSAE